MTKKNIFLLLTTFIIFCSTSNARKVVTLKNPLKTSLNTPKMIELKGQWRNAHWLVTTERGDTLPSQVTYDGLLIFPQPAMRGKEKLRIFIDESDSSVTYKGTHLHGRLFPERQQDFSFENEFLAYRIYGPETMKKGERLYGYDLFLKHEAKPVLETLYARQCDKEMWNTVGKLRKMGQKELADDVYQYGFCYHVDHGEGMDVYKVGATLGAGTNALMNGEKLIMPWCFHKAEVIDNGPLRMTVKLTFSPFTLDLTEGGKQEIIETRLLTIDAGSRMVKATISYSAPLPKGLVPVCGIAIHKENPQAYVMNKDLGYIAYEDLGDPDIYRKKDRQRLDPQKGKTFIGCYVPKAKDCRFLAFEKEISGCTGHVIAIAPPTDQNSFTYYFGYAWSMYNPQPITSMEEWEETLKMFIDEIRVKDER